MLLDAVTSWMREVSIDRIVNSPLLAVIINGLSSEQSFDSSVEALCSIIRETRDVDEVLDSIAILFPAIIGLRPLLREAASDEDPEALKGLTRVFSEAAETWAILVAREPDQFRPLVEITIECAELDVGLEAISYTFIFWEELTQYLTLDTYIEARAKLADLYVKLENSMIDRLEYPIPEEEGEDLFDGDRDREEKFRTFRHDLGDVLKRCSRVLGSTEALRGPAERIQAWLDRYGARATATQFPDWQKLEAALNALRCMGGAVSPNENIMLPRIMPLLLTIPDHPKVRYQVVMVISRYTEWIAAHPDLLEPQFQFVLAAFEHPLIEIVDAAALAFRFFCMECTDILAPYAGPIQQVYATAMNRVAHRSQVELTEGVALIVAKLPPNQVFENLKQFAAPTISKLMELARTASTRAEHNEVAGKCPFSRYLRSIQEGGN
jgi:transportin-3